MIGSTKRLGYVILKLRMIESILLYMNGLEKNIHFFSALPSSFYHHIDWPADIVLANLNLAPFGRGYTVAESVVTMRRLKNISNAIFTDSDTFHTNL